MSISSSFEVLLVDVSVWQLLSLCFTPSFAVFISVVGDLSLVSLRAVLIGFVLSLPSLVSTLPVDNALRFLFLSFHVAIFDFSIMKSRTER